jgi:hypothetical protein
VRRSAETPLRREAWSECACRLGRSNFSLTLCALWLGAAVVAFAESPARLLKLRAVPFTDVKIEDAFWAPRRETNRLASIPVNLDNLVKAGNIRNFEFAAAGKREGFSGPVFMDSDLYKGLEAAAYSLATHPDPDLERRLDDIISKIAAAQQSNGYLNTWFTVKEPGKRWTNLRDQHELYCAGHMFEAAVAYFQATGKRNFLNVAVKLADHIDSVFGPPPKRLGYPGHPEIELALIKLWRVTGEARYFNLARFFVENRGRHFFAEEHRTPLGEYDGAYWQDDVPIYEHKNIKGHAVRACYLLSGATDVAAETGDAALLKMIERVWRNTTERNMYVTGGIGPSSHNEGFTVDYDLPNGTAYQETCATIALAQWNHRLALLYGDAKYADIVERALYNGVLAGVSQDGTRFFYVNPLESQGNHHRSPWFGCACCPPNVARTLASLGGYAYATSDNALWVNLYIQGSVKVNVGGEAVTLKVTTDYPWDGKVTLKPTLAKPTKFTLRLRYPSWCQDSKVAINDAAVPDLKVGRGYLVLARTWQSGDTVELSLSMPVQRIAAHPNVKANQGQLALQRGPLVYCVEACDQPESLASLYLPAAAELKAVEEKNLLGSVMAIEGLAEVTTELDWTRRLYQASAPSRRVPIAAIPYYAWDNRKAGAMRVWLPTAPPVPLAGALEARAKVTLSFVSGNCQPQGINDGAEPKSSGDQPPAVCHWWPHKGSDEWVQYTWKNPITVAGTKVYWFDDTGRGECRLPAAWEVQFLDGTDWKPVKAKGGFPVAADQWCEVSFEPVATTALRLRVKLQKDWAAGVHEWKVLEGEDE